MGLYPAATVTLYPVLVKVPRSPIGIATPAVAPIWKPDVIELCADAAGAAAARALPTTTVERMNRFTVSPLLWMRCNLHSPLYPLQRTGVPRFLRTPAIKLHNHWHESSRTFRAPGVLNAGSKGPRRLLFPDRGYGDLGPRHWRRR